MLAGIIVLFISFCFLFIQIQNASARVKKTKTNRKADAIKTIVSYNYDGTLNVNKRDYSISDVVSIAEDHNIVTAYNPETLHIGAVSVGGVVSGGAYTTGGNHYIANSEKSGKYTLIYGGDRKIINSIWLTPELYKQAENSSISKYLDKSNHTIKVIEDVYLSDYDLMWKKANIQAGNLGLTEAEKRGYPSYEKCKEILNWLCSNS